jgi:hypothetical protein
MGVYRISWDESGGVDQPGNYVLAGISVNIDAWRSMNAEWRKVLNQKPRIPYFKMSEAMRTGDPESVFFSWTKKQVNAKVRRLRDAIKRSSHHVILSSFSIDDFNKAKEKSALNEKYKDPYLVAFAGSLLLVNDSMSRSRDRHMKPVLVYDSMDHMIRKRATTIYDGIASTAYGTWLPTAATYDDDKLDMGLQAADLLAWIYRNLVKDQWHRGEVQRRFGITDRRNLLFRILREDRIAALFRDVERAVGSKRR